jgi:tripartite-type tricarboxylate transporter receptor subunit TctC
MRHAFAAAIAALTIAVTATPAMAQSFPERPIRLIVPIAPGSVTDVIMRAAAIELSPRLGQQVVIENRAGANFIVGAQACAAAAPDGYTICVVNNNSLSINPLIYNSMPYDAQKDFTPITNLFLLVEALAVATSVPVNSVAELHALARSKPEALNFGTLGPGSYPDLFLNWLNRKWDTKLVGVPYRGGGPVALAIASNEIQIASMGLGNFIALAGDRKLNILAVSPERRNALLPDVPTFKESGIGDFPGHVWWGLVGPKGMPASVVERLNKEFVSLWRDPKFVAFLEKQAVQPYAGSAAEFAAFLKKDREDSDVLVKLANAPKSDYTPGK